MIDGKSLKVPPMFQQENIIDISSKKSRGNRQVSLEGKEQSRVDRRNYRGNGHWTFDKQMGEGKAVGFIYVIRNIISDKCYLGKKLYRGTGKVNKGAESNWPWYISSAKGLSEDIKESGKEGFEFICIEEYFTKGELSWAETWSLCHVEVPTNKDIWYNTLINKVSWSLKNGITSKHKERLQMVIDGVVLEAFN